MFFVVVIWLNAMGSRAKGNGKGNKRKFPDNNFSNSKQRNFEEGFPRNEGRWNKPYNYNVHNKMPNHSSRFNAHGRINYRSNQYYRYTQQNSSLARNYPPISTNSHVEQDKGIPDDPVLNSERLEKVLAIKKRIEDAFASKPNNTSNQEMAFEKPAMKETSTENKEKNTDGSVPVDSLEIRLTNSDFKEIGSVASGVDVEGDMEVGAVLNVASLSSQQRSFDKQYSPTIPSSSKQPRIGGWNVSALNDSEAGPLHSNPHVVPPRTSRTIREQFLQESREEILGNIEQNTNKQSVVPKKPKTGCLGIQKPPRVYNSRVGQLYQSFLKSRLSGGFTLKLSKTSSKPAGPNPLLDKSVLENHSNFTQTSGSQAILLEMPRPIIVKLEANNAKNVVTTSDDMEAEEANEFCQEFSHLLTEPNFLIPPEELEKLGLGHLAEMNKLVNERRNCDDSPNTTVNGESYLRVRSLNALNSVTENDITYNPPTSNVVTSPFPELPLNSSFSTTSHVQNNHQDMNYEFVNVPGVNQAQITRISPQVLRNPQSSVMAQDATLQDIHTPVADSVSGNVL